MQLDHAACVLRVFRLATLLTGAPSRARRVVASVTQSQPQLEDLDSAHLDRLTVLHCREVGVEPIDDAAIPPVGARSIATLPPQLREAWVLSRVYRLTDREMSRAMDCSTSAAMRHLQQADLTLASHDPIPLAAALLGHSRAVELPAGVVQRMRRKRAIRRAVRPIGWILLGLSIVAVLVTLWLGRAQ